MSVMTCSGCGAPVATNYCTQCGQARTTAAAEAAVATVNEEFAAARKATFVGLAWMVGATLATFATYMYAGQRGGQYFLLWGAVLLGAYRAVRGLVMMFRVSRQPLGG